MAQALSRRNFLTLDFRSVPFGVTRTSGVVSAVSRTSDHWIRVHRTAMACRFEVALSAEAIDDLPAARAALDEADRIESLLTVFRDTSAIAHVNRRAASEEVAVDAELFDLLLRCRELYERTDGAFDITSTPLSRCWGFLLRAGRIPDGEEFAAARALVGMDRVRLDAASRTVRFERTGMELNFGAIGKGYALDRMGEVLRSYGVTDALLSGGYSSIVATGHAGPGWPIDLKPSRSARTIGRLLLRRGAVGTSGGGEQFFEIDGARYGHVIDPRTGWPSSGVLAASVVTGDGAVADALSTAFLVGGVDLARQYCATSPDTLAVLAVEDPSGGIEVFGYYPGATLEMTS